jgi:hypothetical protein
MAWQAVVQKSRQMFGGLGRCCLRPSSLSPGVHLAAAGYQPDDAGHLATLLVAAHHFARPGKPRL